MTEPYVVNGQSEMDVEVLKSTRCVVLHAKHMTVSSVFHDQEQGEICPQKAFMIFGLDSSL